MFERSGKGLTRLWLQDRDPSRNSKSVHDAMARCHSEVLKIPPRSPDLNPIENIFHIVSRKLEKDAEVAMMTSMKGPSVQIHVLNCSFYPLFFFF